MSNKAPKRDTIYATSSDVVEDFSFNQSVVDVFPDMIARSVPGYTTIVDGIGKLAAEFVQTDSNMYDLGCSLGAVSLSLAKHTQSSVCQIIGVDNSAAMVKRCKEHVGAFSYAQNISIIEADISDIAIQRPSVIVLNFTLQFIAPDKRQALLEKFYQHLLPGGILVLSEKLKLADHKANDALISMHHQFKKENGYSELEISQKRTALEKVMLLDTFDTHQQRLKMAGFPAANLWFQHYNFASFFAIKPT